MDSSALSKRLAVCSWSLRPASAAELAAQLNEVGVRRAQIALDPLREDPANWNALPQIFANHDISLASGMFGMVGEDYSTLEAIRRTGGVVPDEHWEANWANIQTAATVSKSLGLTLVSFHAGFLPHEEDHPDYPKLLQRITRIADLFEANGIALGFETGQETATTLAGFLLQLDKPNVGVNFDPANMLLYDKGDPIEALRKLAPWLKQCHIKDAALTHQPGTWGTEVVVGTGEVDWKRFFATLEDLGFTGDLCIEREAGDQRIPDIRAARQFLEQLDN